MRIVASFLILLLCISDKAQSFSCDKEFQAVFQLTGVVASKVPVVSEFVSIFGIISKAAAGDCIGTSIRNIAKDEDRKQEAQQAMNTLKAHLITLKEIESYSDVRKNDKSYDDLRKKMRDARILYFDSFNQFHESKFKIFTQYGDIELALIEIMLAAFREIRAAGDDIDRYRKLYGETLLYYIEKGSEMYSKFPLELTHSSKSKSDRARARAVAKSAAEDLRPTLVEWIEAVETNTEIRERLRLIHKGLDRKPSDSSSQWATLGVNRKYLPLKISDGDWIAMKFLFRREEASWLSCYQSITEEDYCSYRACPNVGGNQGANECKSERFQIQSTAHGPIKFGGKYAFKYWDWDCSEGRGKGTYWLSTAYGVWKKSGGVKYNDVLHRLYTMPCLGSDFTKHDIAGCGAEVFTFTPRAKGAKYLRNGDNIHINEIEIVDYGSLADVPTKSSYSAFIMRQFHQTGDKNYC